MLSIVLLVSACPAPQTDTTPPIPAGVNAKSWRDAAKRVKGFRFDKKNLTIRLFANKDQVQDPAAICFDDQNRLYVAENHRLKRGGVDDNRQRQFWFLDDISCQTVEDRLAMYKKWESKYPASHYTKYSERIITLEDRDGDGMAEHRVVYADKFNDPLDGPVIGLIAKEGKVYLTCIPHVWVLEDTDSDGVADKRRSIQDGFGVRVSLSGHDMHGLAWGPDGRLYWSIGDRGYNFTTKEGRHFENPASGAVFRCNPDGSDVEIYHEGLRNPQELAFDDHGNLFTFDNTGDIGDRARIVYVLENTDSGWDMSHQSPHHYRRVLDWGQFHPSRAMWVAEQMFDTYRKEQPQWVYPPVGHVANGPSGVAWLTGESVPEDLRGQFLLTNFRGAPNSSNTLAIDLESKGAGFHFKGAREVISGLAAADVELGYDGRLYFADFGGGWSVNKNGSIQVLEPKDPALLRAGAAVAQLFAKGLGDHNLKQLAALLAHPDQRVRKLAQFELVECGATGKAVLLQVAQSKGASLVARLHAIWGLGQLGRQGKPESKALLGLLKDDVDEVRANAARVVGDLRLKEARDPLLAMLADKSVRVRSLATIAMGRVGQRGDEEVIEALYQTAAANASPFDVALRHSCLSALDHVGTVGSAAKKAAAPSVEERLLAVLFLRRHQSPKLADFLSDADPAVRIEVIRAIYDTKVLDTWVGDRLATLDGKGLPETVQRRIVGANYRKGTAKNAKRLIALAGDAKLHKSVRQAALHGLRTWEASIDTDPVLGHYRPQVVKERTMKQLGVDLTGPLRRFISSKQDSSLTALATKLAGDCGVALDLATSRKQVVDATLDPELRVATLDSLAQAGQSSDDALILKLLDDKEPLVQAAALRHGFARNLDGVAEFGYMAVKSGPLPAARSGIAGLAQQAPSTLKGLWLSREKRLRRELWLDAYLALSGAKDSKAKQAAASFAVSDPNNVFSLSEVGGDAFAGGQVFRNHGACLQCHKVGSEGGVQGPDLSIVAERLKPSELLQSMVNPGAVIAEGYGLSSVILKNGSALVGRVPKQTDSVVQVIALDGKVTDLKPSEVASITPPVSPMPPLGMTLPPRDLRDLIAFLASQTPENDAKRVKLDHGKEE